MQSMSTNAPRRRFSRSLLAAVFSFAMLLAVPVPDALADSLREVAERVARQHDGKVIAAREVQRSGRRYYEIRILTRDGVVKTIRVPADNLSTAQIPALSQSGQGPAAMGSLDSRMKRGHGRIAPDRALSGDQFRKAVKRGSPRPEALAERD